MAHAMNDRCVLFYGDSFVNGAGDPTGQGWPAHVTAASWEAGVPLTAYNLGVRGESLPQVAARFAAAAEPRLIEEADNRAVIAAGANDVSLREDGAQDVSTEESLAALASMLDEAARLGMRVLVLGPGPAGVTDHDQRSRELGQRLAGLAGERGARYLDVLDELLASEAWARGARSNDGIHPDAGGYAELARLVLDGGWIEWLREPADEA